MDAVAEHIQRTARPALGARALLVYPPGLEMIAALQACSRIGLIPVPVYPPSKQDPVGPVDRMEHIARDCGATLMLTTRACAWLIRWARVKRSLDRRTLAASVVDRLPRLATDEAPPGEAAPAPRTAPDDLLFLQYTSGSTSAPKGVRVTQSGLLANYRSTVDHDPVCVSWLPQYHDLGLIGYHLFIALHGGTTYGFSPVDFIRRPALWLETLSRVGATASAAPNFALAYCLRPDKVPDALLDGLDLSRLDYLATAAEPVHAETFRRFAARFARCGLKPGALFASYGLAEFTLVVSQYGRTIRAFDRDGLGRHAVRPSEPGSARTKELVSCGRPLPCTQVAIVAPDGRRCRGDEVGEIWLSGPSVGDGYWGRPELSERVFGATLPGSDARWLRTGDLGFLRDDELYLSGRLKDLIIVRGRNHYPQDIEAVVEADPAIRPGCSAAFAVAREGTEGVVVVAELRDPSRLPDARDLTTRLHTTTGLGGVTWVFVRPRTVAKTSSGKIRRGRVREDFLAGRLAVVERLAPRAAPASAHALSRVFARYGLRGDEPDALPELGLDSLQLAELARDLETESARLGVPVEPALLDLRVLQTLAPKEIGELANAALDPDPEARDRTRLVLARLRRERHAVEVCLMREDAEPPPEAWSVPAAPWSPEGGVLLTGGTGFLGPFLVDELLRCSADPLAVLMRSPSPAAARARLLDALARCGRPVRAADAARLRVVCGDLARPRLGLDSATWTELARSTHTLVHNGAAVNYLHNYEAMRAANVLGTRELVRLALAERRTVFNHVSTTFVFGWSRADTIGEADVTEDLDLLDFGYSQTKWVAERIVRQAIDAGMPGRVFRPALISPTADCAHAEADIAMRLLAFIVRHGIGTSAPNQVSFTPVDVVARNIARIAASREALGQTLHVTRDAYASLADVTRLLVRRTGRRIELLPLRPFVDAVVARCTPDDPLFPLLNFFVRSTDEIAAMSFKRYDNRRYRAARARTGGAADPPLEEVVGGIHRFLVDRALVPAPMAPRSPSEARP